MRVASGRFLLKNRPRMWTTDSIGVQSSFNISTLYIDGFFIFAFVFGVALTKTPVPSPSSPRFSLSLMSVRGDDAARCLMILAFCRSAREVSRAREAHPCALAEPDVRLSPPGSHGPAAPLQKPPVGETAMVVAAQRERSSALFVADGVAGT